MRYSVLHRGVPVGAVELRQWCQWAGGLLEPLPAYEAVRPALEAAAATGVPLVRVAALLRLPAGAPDDDAGAWPAVDAFRRAAGLEFELRDGGGLPVPAAVAVFPWPGGLGGPRVRAYFGEAPAPVPARLPPPSARGGGDRDPGV